MKVRAKASLDHVVAGEIYDVIRKNSDEEVVVDDKYGNEHLMFDDTEYEWVEEQSSEWKNGKWYPEVGSYCSLYKNPDVNTSKDDSLIHNKIKILAYDAGDVVYRVVDGKYFPIESQKDIQFIFKPIKSEKDKEIEKIDDVIDEWQDELETMAEKSLAEYLYEKGLRFKDEN